MQIRTALVACVLVLGTLAAIVSASAGDNYGGFGPSNIDTQEIGSDPDIGGPAPEDYQSMETIQPQGEAQQDIYGSESAQQGADDNGYDMDDEGGH